METFQLAGSGPAYYEKHLVPRLFEPLAERVVTLVDASEGMDGLDVACGTGVVARRLAAAGVRVTGVDLNADMLALARSLAPDLTWVEGDAQALPLPPASFDLATCQQGLQFMPDPGAAVRAIHTVLRPGGRVAVAVWRPLRTVPGFDTLTDALDRRIGPDAGDVLRGPFALGDPGPVRDLFSQAGFADLRVHNHCHATHYSSVDELVRSEISSTPLAVAAESWPPDAIPNLIADVTAALADYVADDGVLFPICAYVITGTVGQAP
jgi:ubiquinone/menaquinone biosynthesis C-methylase UbiE